MLNNLSIVILTDRKDQLFIDCLKSAYFAKEILVLDYQSENDWQTLNKNKKIRIINKLEKIENFSAVRNEAIALVKTDWLLMLDSDEILQKNAECIIKKLLENKAVAAYQLKRKDVFYKHVLKHGEVGNLWITRLAQTKKIEYQRRVHETPIIDGKIKKSQLVIRHYAHQNLKEFFTAINGYAKLESAWRVEKNWHYSKLRWIIEFFFYPSLKFIQNYLLKLGFLDGLSGFNYAVMMSFHSLLVRVYLYEKYFLT